MPTYITLNRFTEEALDDLEAMEDVMAEDIVAIEELGGEFHGLWLTFGQYDAVGITGLPDDETAMRLVGHLNRNRGTRTETLKAIPADEAGELLTEGI